MRGPGCRQPKGTYLADKTAGLYLPNADKPQMRRRETHGLGAWSSPPPPRAPPARRRSPRTRAAWGDGPQPAASFPFYSRSLIRPDKNTALTLPSFKSRNPRSDQPHPTPLPAAISRAAPVPHVLCPPAPPGSPPDPPAQLLPHCRGAWGGGRGRVSQHPWGLSRPGPHTSSLLVSAGGEFTALKYRFCTQPSPASLCTCPGGLLLTLPIQGTPWSS